MKASDIVNRAIEELGYYGKKNIADNLDVKAAPNGTGDFTKYARDLYAAGYYNGNKNGYEWCCCFVDWLFLQLAGSKETASLVNPVNQYSAACDYSAGAYSANGIADYSPRVGDKAWIMNGKNCVHCILIIGYDDEANTITTIEGNTENDCVESKIRSLDKCKVFFGHPRYEAEDEPENAEIAEVKQYETPVIEEIVEAKVSDTITIPRDEYNGYLRTIAELSSGKTAAEQRAELAEQELENIREALKKLL